MSSLNNSPNTIPFTSSSPPPISPMVPTKKRATRTYGSKREDASPSDESPDADKSFGTLVDGDVSIPLSPVVRPPGIDDNTVSSQDTKVDDDDDKEKEDSPRQQRHKWSWEAMLKELSESDEEAQPAPTPPVPRRSAGVDGSSPHPASRSRSTKSKGKHFSASPRKSQRLPLRTIRSDSRASSRVSVEPEASGSDGDNSPHPSPPKQKRRTVSRVTDTVIAEDSDSEAPRASSSKPWSSRLSSADMDGNDRTSPGPAKRKRKTTTSRKPTAKVNLYDIRYIGFY